MRASSRKDDAHAARVPPGDDSVQVLVGNRASHRRVCLRGALASVQHHQLTRCYLNHGVGLTLLIGELRPTARSCRRVTAAPISERVFIRGGYRDPAPECLLSRRCGMLFASL